MQAFKNIKIGLFISLVNIIIQGVNLVVQNLIAKNLGIVDFGHFGMLQSDYTIFCAVSDFGMMSLILAYFGGRAVHGSLFIHILQLRIFMTIIAGIGMLFFAFFIRNNSSIFWGELILIPGLFFQHAFFDWFFICGQFWKKLLCSKILHTLSLTIIMGASLYVFQINSIESIAIAMVVSAIPAFGFGVRQAFSSKILKLGLHSKLFFKLMLKSASPYALTNIATYAYLPTGLYTIAYFATPEFLGAYNFSHKLVLLASSLMVYFIYSSVLTMHQSNSQKISFRDQAVFVGFTIIATSPFWFIPHWVLKMIFFAAPWTEPTLEISTTCLRILCFSLIFQAMRLGMIATLLKEKKTLLYGLFILLGGALNIIICISGAHFVQPNKIPLLTLSGDIFLTLFLTIYFIKNRRICW